MLLNYRRVPHARNASLHIEKIQNPENGPNVRLSWGTYFLVKQHGDVAAALPPNFRGFVRRKLKQTWDSENYSLWSGKGKKTIEFLRIYQTRGIILNCSSFSVVRLGFPNWTLRANRIVQPLQSRHNKNFGTWVNWINHSWCSPSPAQEGSLLIQSRHSVLLLPQKGGMVWFFCTPLR